MRPDEQLGIYKFAPKRSRLVKLARRNQPIERDRLAGQEIDRTPDTAYATRGERWEGDWIAAVKDLPAGLQEFLDSYQITRTVFDVIDTIYLKQFFEQGRCDVEA